MKMKTQLRISSFMMVPAILSLMFNMIISEAYWNDDAILVADMKSFNHSLAFYTTFIGWFCVVFIIATYMRLSKYSDCIDSLEEEEKEYKKATKEMEDARDAYTELLKNKKN